MLCLGLIGCSVGNSLLFVLESFCVLYLTNAVGDVPGILIHISECISNYDLLDCL